MTDRAPHLHLYVWDERFLYLGPSTATTLHRNHAAVWLAGADGKLRVTMADGTRFERQVVFLPSGAEYASEEDASLIAALYWEPESASYQRIAERFDNVPRGFDCLWANGEGWAILQKYSTTLSEAEQLMAKIFDVPADPSEPAPLKDPRIAAALTLLREAPQDYDHLETLAERVHLSPSRFAHLFKDEVGVPVRRYVLWLKMRRALDHAIAGDSLTSAAISAGFADSAHLSRTVRAMMGVAPEFLFRHRERLVIHK